MFIFITISRHWYYAAFIAIRCFSLHFLRAAADIFDTITGWRHIIAIDADFRYWLLIDITTITTIRHCCYWYDYYAFRHYAIIADVAISHLLLSPLMPIAALFARCHYCCFAAIVYGLRDRLRLLRRCQLPLFALRMRYYCRFRWYYWHDATPRHAIFSSHFHTLLSTPRATISFASSLITIFSPLIATLWLMHSYRDYCRHCRRLDFRRH